MTFASEIIEDAAAFIMVGEEDISIEPNEFQQGARILNDYCAELFGLGVDIGYRPVSSSGDPVTVPSSVNLALKQNLGLLLAPMFGISPQPALVVQAGKSERRMKAQFTRRIRSTYPGTLPMGSGNRTSGFISSAFYPFTPPMALLRLNASTTVTIAAIDTPVVVSGWTVDQQTNVNAATAGTVEYLNDGSYLASLEASLTISAATDQFTFYFMKNGAKLEQSALVFDADAAQNIRLRWFETLRRGDTVSIAVENNEDTTNLTITDGHFTVN